MIYDAPSDSHSHLRGARTPSKNIPHSSERGAFRADLHCHSICSDGSDEPITLIEKAKIAGLQGLSITDHDTMSAYTSEFFAAAAQAQIRILTGVELSSALEEHSVHILGYGCDFTDHSLITFLEEIQKCRKERNCSILQKLREKGMPIEEAELEGIRIAGRPHIAHLMVNKGYVSSIREAFDRYLKDEASCYVAGFKISPKEAIEKIHLASGKAILAHPHFYKKGAFLRRLLSLPFDGAECYYAHLDKKLELPWVQLAKERKWLATGGSDYHGAFKPHISLGASWVNEVTFNTIYHK